MARRSAALRTAGALGRAPRPLRGSGRARRRAVVAIGGSLLVHAAALLIGAQGGRAALDPPRVSRAATPRLATPDPIELEFVAPPAAPAPRAPAEPAVPPAPRVARASERRAVTAARRETTAAPAGPRVELAPTPTRPAPATAPNARSAPPAPDGLELLRAAAADAERAAAAGVLALPAATAARARDLVPRASGTLEARARAASQGYVATLLRGSDRDAAPAGLRRYYWFLRRRMAETWQPPALPAGSPVATRVRAAVRSAVSDTETAQRVQRDSLGAAGTAGDMPARSPTFAAVASASATRIAVEVELDQDATGRVLAARVGAPSRVAGFDAAAIAAVRAAVALQAAPRWTGARRSRWRFEIETTHDAALVPWVDSRTGARGVWFAGGDFDENTGTIEVRIPGVTSQRRARITLQSSTALARPGTVREQRGQRAGCCTERMSHPRPP